MICYQVNLLFLHLCLKSKPEELRSHKVVTAMSMRNQLLCQISTPRSGSTFNVKYQSIRKFEFMARNATIVSVEVNISIY